MKNINVIICHDPGLLAGCAVSMALENKSCEDVIIVNSENNIEEQLKTFNQYKKPKASLPFLIELSDYLPMINSSKLIAQERGVIPNKYKSKHQKRY